MQLCLKVYSIVILHYIGLLSNLKKALKKVTKIDF